MIYRLKFVSDETEHFSRTLEIDASASFLTLRDAVLDSVDFGHQEMNSFFMCDDRWNPAQEITMIDMGTSSDEDCYIMESTALEEFLDEEGQKLIFMFDIIAQRCFFMELVETRPGEYLDAPKCVDKVGKAPKETISFDELDKKIDQVIGKKGSSIADDLDADFYGDSEYDADELGSGFDSLSPN